MEKLNKIVANNLINLRKMNGLTQNDFASKLNYSNKTISKWELGYAIPNVETLKDIADYYGVSVDYFLVDHEIKNGQTEVIKTFQYRLAMMLLIDVFFLAGSAVAYVIGVSFTSAQIWPSFIYAAAFSCFFNAIVVDKWWHNRLVTEIFASLTVWGLLFAIYFTLLTSNITYNFWYLFFLGLPIQAAIILIFIMRKQSK